MEYFDIVDTNNVPTGEKKSREQVHSEKVDWHRTTHIWIYNRHEQILCQQRSLSKDAHPGKWQSFFGGHVKSGQTVEECVQEELLEEIGVDMTHSENSLEFAFVRSSENSKHFGYTYFLELKDPENIVFQDGEVEQVAWMDIPTIQSKIDSGEFCNQITESVKDYLRTKSFPNS